MVSEDLRIPKEEYKERQEKCRKAAAEKNYNALMVWSRGGGTVERYAEVLYLANHYSEYPFTPNLLPHYSARGHSVVIIPVDDEPVLLVDIPYYREDLIAVDDVRNDAHLLRLAVEVLKEKGLAKAKIGLVGTDMFPLQFLKYFEAELPNLEFVEADDILVDMRIYKSESEKKLIRKAAEIGNRAMIKAMESVVEGNREVDVAVACGSEIIGQGAMIWDMAMSSGPQSNRYIFQRFPPWETERRFEKGDLFHIDIYGAYQGYQFDFARSTVVGCNPTPDQEHLLESVSGAVEKVVENVQLGAVFEDLGTIGYEYLYETGLIESRDFFKTTSASGCLSFGHGLGLSVGKPQLMIGNKMKVEKDMCLAVEKLVAKEGVGGVQFEENLLVNEDGIEVLTGSVKTKWWEEE
jgi:Xaa-Pro aminopeptidase